MNILLGIGNADKGDDGAGPLAAEQLTAEGWIGLDGGMAPENMTGVIRRHRPERILIVDAANMGLAAGSMRRVHRNSIEDVGIGTHMLPLSHLIDYLSELTPAITLIGIQPDSTGYGEPMHPAVKAAVETLLELVRHDELDTVEEIRNSSFP